MTSAKVIETSVRVTSNSPSQDYTHPDDHNLRTYDLFEKLVKDNSLKHRPIDCIEFASFFFFFQFFFFCDSFFNFASVIILVQLWACTSF